MGKIVQTKKLGKIWEKYDQNMVHKMGKPWTNFGQGFACIGCIWYL